jgi:uncharacterized caspase-like protein
MKLKLALCFIFFCFIWGCATQQFTQKPFTLLPKPGFARIILERERSLAGVLRLMEIKDESQVIGNVANGGNLTWDRPPGLMNLSVNPTWDGMFVNSTPLTINVSAGTIYRVKAKPVMNGLVFSAVLSLQSTEGVTEGKYHTSDTDPAPPDYVKKTDIIESDMTPGKISKESEPKKEKLLPAFELPIKNHIEDLSPAQFGQYYAIVIGNNNYAYLPKLKSAINDAQEIASLLKNNYGFKVDILLDAKRSDILLALTKLRENLSGQDNLLIYYAGHGWLDKEGDEGYWLPIDATKENELNWISNSSITTTLKAMEAKHVLIVADSCYSGKLGRSIHIQKKSPDYYSRLAQKRARSVLASGGLEPVIDSGGKGNHSVFAAAFLEVLQGNTKIIDCTELFNEIRRPVMLTSEQTPEYADIRKAGHDGGEFIFVRIK